MAEPVQGAVHLEELARRLGSVPASVFGFVLGTSLCWCYLPGLGARSQSPVWWAVV